jgi:hypothetical protein
MSEQHEHGPIRDADRQAAPDASSQGVDEQVQPDETDDTVTLRQESSVGPGAGNAPVVKVTAPVQHEEGNDVTKHPTLRQKD